MDRQKIFTLSLYVVLSHTSPPSKNSRNEHSWGQWWRAKWSLKAKELNMFASLFSSLKRAVWRVRITMRISECKKESLQNCDTIFRFLASLFLIRLGLLFHVKNVICMRWLLQRCKNTWAPFLEKICNKIVKALLEF